MCEVSLAEALERAATALPEAADQIRPANGDAYQLLEMLGGQGAARVLCWMLVNEPNAAEELVGAWSDEPEGISILGGISEEGLPKAGRRVLRRAHHRLRSRGVQLPTEAPSSHVARLPQVDAGFGGAFVSMPDPEGVQLVYLIEPSPSGGGRLFEALLDPGLGILRFSAFRVKRGESRRFLRAAERSETNSLVEAEVAATKALLARAAARQVPSIPLPRTYIEWAYLFNELLEQQTPGERILAELGMDRETAVEEVAFLLASKLGPWAPDAGRLSALRSALAEANQTDLRMSTDGGEAGQLAEHAVEQLSEALLVPESWRMLSARFCEAAYVFWKRGNRKDAKTCAAAVQFLSLGLSGDDPLGRTFIEGVRKLLEQGKLQNAKASKLTSELARR